MFVAIVPWLSCTWIVKEPGPVAVPEIRPVWVLRLIPFGSAPVEIENVYGEEPPDTAGRLLNGTPTPPELFAGQDNIIGRSVADISKLFVRAELAPPVKTSDAVKDTRPLAPLTITGAGFATDAVLFRRVPTGITETKG